jgi:kinesin family protein 6/9
LKESISTCRFAQRVALIKNEALVNEELDPKLIINRLKREVEELKNQLAISQTEYNAAELTNYEIEK